MSLLQRPYLTGRSWLFEKGIYEQDPWHATAMDVSHLGGPALFDI